MGVDFFGYSNVKRIPIPPEFQHRFEKVNVSHGYIKIIHDHLTRKENGIPQQDVLSLEEVFALRSSIHGETFEKNGVFRTVSIIPDTPEYHKWKSTIEEDPQFHQFLWEENVYIMTTEKTERFSIGRTYSGFREFWEYIQTIYPIRVNINPYSGSTIIKSEDIESLLEDLQTIYAKIDIHIQRNPKFLEEHEKLSDWDVEFLQGMIRCLCLASQDGIFCIW
jgi:hypothetical protein